VCLVCAHAMPGGMGAGLSVAYSVIVGLGVPAMTFIGLWLWRLRYQSRHAAESGSFLAEAQLAELAAGISTREERLRNQLTGLYHDWQERDAQPAAQRDAQPAAQTMRKKASQAPERSGILLDAVTLAAATGDRQELLQRITEFVVPSLADYCIVYLSEGEERLRAAAVANTHPGRDAAFARVREYPIAISGPMPAQIAYHTGTLQLVPDITVHSVGWAEREPDLADVLARPHVQSALAAPMTADGQRLGALVMGRDGSRVPFADSDIAMAEDLSRGLAAALAHADAFTRDRAVADILQRSLLPETLPVVPGLDLAVRYLPATDGAAVGGDWYDAFPLDTHRVGLVIGDVFGHSITSASVMGQVRTLLRTCILDVPSPGEVLRRANLALEQLLPEAMATVACVVLDPATGEFTYASAGHPPPLVTAGTTAEYLDGGAGIMLGTGTDAPFPAARCRLPAGSGLLLYTDGLIEDRRRDIGVGMRSLAAALRHSAPRTAEQMCSTAHKAMLGAASRADDICLLAAWRES
jgi:stage II sporulation SpoE-like protein/GAF domain-containing protein